MLFLCGGCISITEVTTLRLDSRVRKCVHDLQDEHLLAKLSSKDTIAQEAKYHPKCLVALYNKAAALHAEYLDQHDRSDKLSHGIALAELLALMKQEWTKTLLLFSSFQILLNFILPV